MTEGFTDYYRRFPGDYLRDTITLTLAEDGVYGRLLDHQYNSEMPIPNEAEACRVARARTKSERKIVQKILLKFFELTPTGWVNPRFEKELTYAESKRTKAKASANARWNKDANALPTHSERNAIPDNQTTRQPEQEKSLGATAPRGTPFFDGFELDAELIIFANEQGVNAEQEFAAFRDHHKANGNFRKDWKAAFRSWVRNAKKFGGNGNGKESFSERNQRKAADAIGDVRRRAREVLSEVGSGLPKLPSEAGDDSRLLRSPRRPDC